MRFLKKPNFEVDNIFVIRCKLAFDFETTQNQNQNQNQNLTTIQKEVNQEQNQIKTKQILDVYRT
jgi:hypothetical protein